MDGEVEGDGGEGEGAGDVHNVKECNLHHA